MESLSPVSLNPGVYACGRAELCWGRPSSSLRFPLSQSPPCCHPPSSAARPSQTWALQDSGDRVCFSLVAHVPLSIAAFQYWWIWKYWLVYRKAFFSSIAWTLIYTKPLIIQQHPKYTCQFENGIQNGLLNFKMTCIKQEVLKCFSGQPNPYGDYGKKSDYTPGTQPSIVPDCCRMNIEPIGKHYGLVSWEGALMNTTHVLVLT